ncbi:MAG: hypothetical protein BIFFINMI_03965 [Phycisphaerae bacterium]|nr:hypothetical protein [Phycisphaerae bacterium]
MGVHPVRTDGSSHASRAWIAALVGGPGLAAALLWGAAEGSLFFVLPDVVFTLAALFAPLQSLRHVGMALAGALIAGGAMFAWSARAPESAHRAVAAVPWVRPGMFDRVAADLDRYGAWGLCRGPASGIPYKVYAVQAPGRTSAAAFLLATVPGRLERLLLTWLGFAVVGWKLTARIARRPSLAVGLWAFFWIALYAWYWTVI